MSVFTNREQKPHDVRNIQNFSNRKCRIPQRLGSVKQRPLSKFRVPSEKPEIVSLYQTHKVFHRNGSDTRIRPTTTRPKSANRATDQRVNKAEVHPRSAKPDKDRTESDTPKHNFNEKIPVYCTKPTKLVIVPKDQKTLPTSHQSKSSPSTLPDQETITKCEDYELMQGDVSDAGPAYDNECESITTQSEKLIQIKMEWQEKKEQFERMRDELNDRQSTVVQAYAALRNTQEKLELLGQGTNSALIDDLRFMNVAQMTPQQLLQLCEETKASKEDKEDFAKTYLNIDITRIDNMSAKIFTTCEQALKKRKELIDWFDNIKNNERECSKSKLTKKINEFNAENEMLEDALQAVKTELVKGLHEITDIIRKCVNETIAVSLRNEDLTYELSELNSQNSDLRKQIYNIESLKPHQNKAKIEELEKKFKEEKGKTKLLKERLTKTEGQLKIFENRATRLESALEQARTQGRNLERTIQHLRDQNKDLQKEFDEELHKLNDSIKENSKYLEEIADARMKLQTEKEDLENRLKNLSNYYNESIDNMKQEINVNVAKIIETEKKYNQEMEEKRKLQTTVEIQCAQLVEAELRNKDTVNLLKEAETKLNKIKMDALNEQKETENLKGNLTKANNEIMEYKKGLMEQSKTMEEMQKSMKSSCILEEQLKEDINNKAKYIADLENKIIKFEHQSKDSESKMQYYEKQLLSLKEYIENLKEEIENKRELNDSIIEKNHKLNELSDQNDKLSTVVQKQAADLDCYIKTITEQEHFIKQKDAMINVLTEKEKEQTKIILALNKKIEFRAREDTDADVKLIEQNNKIESLISDLDRKDKQMRQLEKVIITLDDQTRKATAQRKKYQERISILEKVIAEYESYTNDGTCDPSAENLDNLIKVLENEMDTTISALPDGQNYKTEYRHKKPIYKLERTPRVHVHKEYGLNDDQSLGYYSGRSLTLTKNNHSLSDHSESEMHGDIAGPAQYKRKYRPLLRKLNNECFPKQMLKDEFLKDAKEYKMFPFTSHKFAQ